MGTKIGTALARAAVTVAVTVGTVVATATPAAADPWGELVLRNSDKVWKASAWYKDSINEVCIRAWHSVSSSYAEIWVRDQTGEVNLHFRDYGGNDVETCRSVPMRYDGRGVGVELQHVSDWGKLEWGSIGRIL